VDNLVENFVSLSNLLDILASKLAHTIVLTPLFSDFILARSVVTY